MFNFSSGKIKSAVRFWIPYLGLACAALFVWTFIMSEWKQITIQEENLAETKIIKSQQALMGINNTILSEIAINGLKAATIIEDMVNIQRQLKKLLQEHEALTNQILHNQENLKKDCEKREAVINDSIAKLVKILSENNDRLKEIEAMLKTRIR